MVIESKMDLNTQSLLIIGDMCKRVLLFDIKNTSLPISILPYFAVDDITFLVGRVDMNMIGASVEETRNAMELFGKVHQLGIEAVLNCREIRELLVVPSLALVKLSINGVMSHADIERIKRHTVGLSSLTVDTTYFDLWHIQDWPSLVCIIVKEAVQLRVTLDNFYLDNLSIFSLENTESVSADNFKFLVGLHNLQTLILRNSFLLCINNIREAHLSSKLQHLDLTCTGALVDDLLRFLIETQIFLRCFQANYPTGPGFTENAVADFLNVPDNSRLERLGLGGHSALGPLLFVQPIFSLLSLRHIDLTDCGAGVSSSLIELANQRRNSNLAHIQNLGIRISTPLEVSTDDNSRDLFKQAKIIVTEIPTKSSSGG
jgi:hypothetical protein